MEWRQLALAVFGLHAEDRVVLVSLLRQLAQIEAQRGPDVAEAALESLIQRLNSPEEFRPN
jgi:hypothetical protein